MTQTENKELLLEIYNELTSIRAEIDEIKQALIPEEKAEDWEIEEIREGEREIAEGKYRKWEEVKKEL